MHRKSFQLAFLPLSVLLSLLLAACTVTLPTVQVPTVQVPTVQENRDTLFQAATLSALNAGDFDGVVTMAVLKRHGDFGLGTFDALDGEMVVLDGEVYQVRDDGMASIADDATETPFAAVTFFDADQRVTLDVALDCPQLQTYVDGLLSTPDAPYAIAVSGEFAALTVRAPRMQREPYPTLTEALVDQAIFESQNISGTMVGFRLPDYLAGANAAGYHFHFIAADRQSGGHVLACRTGAVTLEIDGMERITIDVGEGIAE